MDSKYVLLKDFYGSPTKFENYSDKVFTLSYLSTDVGTVKYIPLAVLKDSKGNIPLGVEFIPLRSHQLVFSFFSISPGELDLAYNDGETINYKDGTAISYNSANVSPDVQIGQGENLPDNSKNYFSFPESADGIYVMIKKIPTDETDGTLTISAYYNWNPVG